MSNITENTNIKFYSKLPEPFMKAKEYVADKHRQKNGDLPAFYAAVSELVAHEKVQEMKQYNHHSQTDCFTHSIHVAYYNYKMCEFFSLDKEAAARAGILHDLFLYDWHHYQRQEGERLHGFAHPQKALDNARKYFDITELEADMIRKHMFPLTISLPKYKETVIIVMTDKFCSSCEILDRFFKKKSRRLVHIANLKKKLAHMEGHAENRNLSA